MKIKNIPILLIVLMEVVFGGDTSIGKAMRLLFTSLYINI